MDARDVALEHVLLVVDDGTHFLHLEVRWHTMSSTIPNISLNKYTRLAGAGVKAGDNCPQITGLISPCFRSASRTGWPYQWTAPVCFTSWRIRRASSTRTGSLDFRFWIV
jgi:hypothetical protein